MILNKFNFLTKRGKNSKHCFKINSNLIVFKAKIVLEHQKPEFL